MRAVLLFLYCIRRNGVFASGESQISSFTEDDAIMLGKFEKHATSVFEKPKGSDVSAKTGIILTLTHYHSVLMSQR